MSKPWAGKRQTSALHFPLRPSESQLKPQHRCPIYMVPPEMRFFHMSGLFLGLGTPERREPGPCQWPSLQAEGRPQAAHFQEEPRAQSAGAGHLCPPRKLTWSRSYPQSARCSHTGPGDLQTRLGSHQCIFAPAVPSARSNAPHTHTPSHAGFLLSNLSSKVTSSEDRSGAVSITAPALFPAEPLSLSETTSNV